MPKKSTLLKCLPLALIALGVTVSPLWQFHPAIAQADYQQVKKVTDGDTLTLASGVRVRLCGIDAPEQDQPMGRQSGDYLRSLIAQAGNRVIVQGIKRDQYGRLVAEVFISAPTLRQPEQERFLNAEMVNAGMAYHYARYSGDCPNRGIIVQAESQAQRQRRGVWGMTNAVKPWDWRRRRR